MLTCSACRLSSCARQACTCLPLTVAQDVCISVEAKSRDAPAPPFASAWCAIPPVAPPSPAPRSSLLLQPSYTGRPDLLPALRRGMLVLRVSVARALHMARFRAAHMQEAAALRVELRRRRMAKRARNEELARWGGLGGLGHVGRAHFKAQFVQTAKRAHSEELARWGRLGVWGMWVRHILDVKPGVLLIARGKVTVQRVHWMAGLTRCPCLQGIAGFCLALLQRALLLCATPACGRAGRVPCLACMAGSTHDAC